MSKFVLGCGNPLLDISAVVPEEVLTKYELSNGNAILAEEKHIPLYAELERDYSVEYIAGGATQNSIRVCQWMLQDQGQTAYVGCIGDDHFGRELERSARKDGVETHYLVDPETPTGTCAVLVVGKERSLVANLAAANKYKKEHAESDEIQQVLADTKIAYSASFFLTVSPETDLLVGRHCAEHDKIFCMNLSAPFLIEFFKEPMMQCLPYMDFVFSNEDEAAKFGEVHGLEDKSVAGVAKWISQYEKINQNRQRTVVFTQGKNPTVVCTNGEVTEYPVPLIDADLIVDTNGAGDSFVGGFLAGLYLGKSMEECVRAGQYAASVVIQHSGCTFPDKPEFSWAN